MDKFRPYKEFTAHGLIIATLRQLLRSFISDESNDQLIEPIVVFTAFSIEAYINHLGAEQIGIWEELEKLPWKKKVVILHKIAHKQANWGEQPLQFAQQVFALRDKLAHGKPELVYGPTCDTREEALDKMREPWLYIPKWYNDINRQWIIESEVRFDNLIIYLGSLFGRNEFDNKLLAYTGVERVES